MKYMIEVMDDEKEFAVKFFKKVSFIKKIKPVSKNEITSERILKRIENYEKKRSKAVAISLNDLKKMIHA